jgi:hypothetical protein
VSAPLVIERAGYRLEVAEHGRTATLATPAGEQLATLRLLAAVDRVGVPDETLAVERPSLDGDTLTIERRSTAWERAGLTCTCHDDRLELRAWVEGAGAIADVHLLAARSVMPQQTDGYLPSGSRFRTLFTPSPSGALSPVRPETAGAVIGVLGDGEPGRQHWLFTPAPLFLALTTAAGEHEAKDWTGLWVTAPVDDLGFVQLRYDAVAGGFGVRLEYEGHTHVDGTFSTPALVLAPGLAGPLAGLERYRRDVVERGDAPDLSQGLSPGPGSSSEAPAWWRAPIFCGWGAQCNLARGGAGIAADHATQAAYVQFLDELEREGVVPGTITIDDKWQEHYGTNTPDPAKWPDLRGFIDVCHARGQRVLLWWKAWDAEGLPPELCVTNADGAPVAFDPSNPAAAEQLRGVITNMLAPEGLNADGLKIDFTARTPSGSSLAAHGAGWGIALLHQLLEIVYSSAKRANPEALIVTHTPHPAFVDVTDMIRLNDMLLVDAAGPLPAVVPQMRYRADVVRAVCPGVPIDTDDWSVPDLATWREYLETKLDIGVPALYYSTHVDATGEAFEASDYAALRRVWAQWEEQGSIPRR